jgi:UDPglucose 6-dehydrogenase
LPDRIVIGTADECGRKVMSDNYGPLSLNQAPLMFTERRTAEMIKYAANAFLATITFINEVRRRLRKSTCRRSRAASAWKTASAPNSHAGPGFGGRALRRIRRR